jgi:hypothetical protein
MAARAIDGSVAVTPAAASAAARAMKQRRSASRRACDRDDVVPEVTDGDVDGDGDGDGAPPPTTTPAKCSGFTSSDNSAPCTPTHCHFSILSLQLMHTVDTALGASLRRGFTRVIPGVWVAFVSLKVASDAVDSH